MEQLLFLQIEPTTRCNFTCGFCAGRSMPQADLELDTFRRAIESYPDLRHIELQGEGEALMHPGFFDMVSIARARGVKVSFISNGSYFTPAHIERLLDGGIEKVSVSIESPDQAEFQAIRGGKLDKVIRGIEALLAARRERGLDRPLVGMSVTVLQSTRGRLPEILALYQRLGLDGGLTMQALQRMDTYARNYDANMAAEGFDDAGVEAVWIDFLADKTVRRLQAERPEHVTGFYDELMAGWRPGSRACPWLDKGMFVNHEGWVTPCCMVKDKRHALGRVGVDEPAAILKGHEKLRLQLAQGEIPEPCSGCDFARYAVISFPELTRLGVKGLWRRWAG